MVCIHVHYMPVGPPTRVEPCIQLPVIKPRLRAMSGQNSSIKENAPLGETSIPHLSQYRILQYRPPPHGWVSPWSNVNSLRSGNDRQIRSRNVLRVTLYVHWGQSSSASSAMRVQSCVDGFHIFRGSVASKLLYLSSSGLSTRKRATHKIFWCTIELCRMSRSADLCVLQKFWVYTYTQVASINILWYIHLPPRKPCKAPHSIS